MNILLKVNKCLRNFCLKIYDKNKMLVILAKPTFKNEGEGFSWAVAQLVECLPSMYKVLGLILASHNVHGGVPIILYTDSGDQVKASLSTRDPSERRRGGGREGGDGGREKMRKEEGGRRSRREREGGREGKRETSVF